MLKAVYTRTLTILKGVPIKLWGLSLLSIAIDLAAMFFFSFPILILGMFPVPVPIPFLYIPIILAINVGMFGVYYKNYTEGVTPDAKPLFAAFKDFQTFKHVIGGMCWQTLWLSLWALIPIAGPFLAVYKSIQYIFTPYILLEEPSVRALDALKRSKEYTMGYKGQIFLGIVLPCIAYFFVVLILSLLGLIPYVGILFIVICAIIEIIFALFASLFFGLVSAGFYEYCRRPVKPVYSAPVAPTPAAPTAPVTPAPAAPEIPADTTETDTSASTATICPTCGRENAPDKKFCGHCGAKLQ